MISTWGATGGLKPASPLSWFSYGEQGAWYDPSDLTTLFQDSAGTTPVTAVEQPVGLMKDKSGRNNHAFQATAGNRPTLSARVNLLLGSAALSTQTITTQATQYVLTFTGTGTVALSGTFVLAAVSSGTYTFTATAGALIVTVVGSVTNADIRPTNIGANLPTYQRVNTSTDYDTTGFPLYLKCNGTSTAMATNSINFSATDKMTIVTGVRKLSDAVNGIVTELGNGSGFATTSFTLNAPSGIGLANYSLSDFATTTANTAAVSGFSSPISNVITGQLDNAKVTQATQCFVRVNGAQPTNTYAGSLNADVNMLNTNLYLFARAGTSLWFNGYFYGLIVCGATRSTQQVQQAETYINLKEGGVY